MAEQKQVQSKTTMILISFFLGGLGIHRLMMGYSNWWLMLITAGGCGIWALVDFIRIITGLIILMIFIVIVVHLMFQREILLKMLFRLVSFHF